MSKQSTATTPRALDVDGVLLHTSLRKEDLPLHRIGPSPCTEACPAGVNVKAYVSLVAEGRYREALEVVRQRCPLPGVCGRVCTHPCEEACRRAQFDQPVGIRALKRFIADYELTQELPPVPEIVEKPGKVAVIGSGPAGLTAAYDLRLAGYQVTVFESEKQPGGMLRYGIMAYRLPHDILDREIEVLSRTGFEIKTSCKLGEDITLEGLQKDGYKAIVLGVGAQLGRKLGVPGEKAQAGIEDALAFLRRVAAGQHKVPGKNVIVIGGGSTAIEAARTALRLGAETVDIVYRRTSEEMPASEEEVKEARAEGVRFTFLASPTKVVAEDSKLKGMEFVKCGLGEADSSGRRRPIPFPGSEYLIEADYVLAAVSQEADLSFLPPQRATELMEGKQLIVEGDTLATRLKGVFAAGDVVTGPSTVIDAIAAGHRVAGSVMEYFETGREPKPAPRRAGADFALPGTIPVSDERQEAPIHSLTKGHEFDEVDLAYTQEQAMREARRCMRCGPCAECHSCVTTCGHRHVLLRPMGDEASGPSVLVRAPSDLVQGLDGDHPLPGWLVASAEARAQGEPEKSAVQVLPVTNHVVMSLCRACGDCIEVCPFHAIQMLERDGQKVAARIEPAECRGCNLCSAVCPTHAAVSGTHPPAWWRSRLQQVLHHAASHGTGQAPRVVLACEAEAEVLSKQLGQNGHQVVLIDLRCVGEVNAGMLLELRRQGAERIVMVGCGGDGCRYHTGQTLAARQVDQARAMLRTIGQDPRLIATDFHAERAVELVEAPLASFLDMSEMGTAVKGPFEARQEVSNA